MTQPPPATPADQPADHPRRWPAPEDEHCKLVCSIFFIAAAGAELFLGCILFLFSILRETHEFWLNSGGYPIPLRDLVLVGYYPLVLLNVMIMLGLTVCVCAKLEFPRGFLKYEILFLCAGWSLFAGSIAISASNNISNFLNDRPLHNKQQGHRP